MRPWPPSVPSTAPTSAACRTGRCCTCATPTRPKRPGRRSGSAMSSARSAPAPATPAWPRPGPAPRPQPPDGPATKKRRPGSRVLAASYRALHDAYRERESVFAGVMADRADWEAATRAQRHLAVAADAELRRRHPRAAVHPASFGRTRSPPRTPSARSSP